MASTTDRSSGSGSFLRRAGPLVVARMFGAAITFCIPLVLARAMSLGEYGTYKQFFLIAQTLWYVLPFGIAQSLYFFVPREAAPRPWVVQTLILLLLGGALGGVLIAVFGSEVATLLQNPDLLVFRWELAFYVAGLVGSLPLEITLTAQGKTRLAAYVYLTSDVLRAAAMVVPVFAGFGLHGAMWATAGVAVLRLCATWVCSLLTTEGPLFDKGLLARQLAYAAPFGAAMLLSIPQQYAHQYAVGAMVPPAVFAIYAVGCFQLPLVDLLYTPTSEVLMVRVGELERQGRVEESVHAFREAGAKLAFAFLPMAAFLFVAAPDFIAAVFGVRFVEATPIFRVSVLGVVLAILPMDGLLRARNETRYLFFSYLVKAMVTVPLVFVGVTSFGMMGGITAWAAAEAIGKLTLLLRVPRALGLTQGSLGRRVLQVLPSREIGYAAACAAGAGILVAFLRHGSSSVFGALPDDFFSRSAPLAAGAIAFTIGYLALLLAVGVRPFAAFAPLLRRRG